MAKSNAATNKQARQHEKQEDGHGFKSKREKAERSKKLGLVPDFGKGPRREEVQRFDMLDENQTLHRGVNRKVPAVELPKNNLLTRKGSIVDMARLIFTGQSGNFELKGMIFHVEVKKMGPAKVDVPVVSVLNAPEGTPLHCVSGDRTHITIKSLQNENFISKLLDKNQSAVQQKIHAFLRGVMLEENIIQQKPSHKNSPITRKEDHIKKPRLATSDGENVLVSSSVGTEKNPKPLQKGFMKESYGYWTLKAGVVIKCWSREGEWFAKAITIPDGHSLEGHNPAFIKIAHLHLEECDPPCTGHELREYLRKNLCEIGEL